MHRIVLKITNMLFILAPILLYAQSLTDRSYTDGVYRASASGHVGDITVELTIRDHSVVDIQVVEHVEYEHEEAIGKMPERILGTGKLEGVDAVSGATETSGAILSAVRKALQKALPEGKSIAEKESELTEGKRSLGTRTWLPTPVWVIGSYDSEGKPNFMTAAWVGIACSRPPCVTLSLREATYTYGNIMERKAYTVNLPPQRFAPQTGYFGRVSGRDVNKLEASEMTAVKGEFVDAPYLKEFPYIVECEVIHVHNIGLHTMFIGEIKDIKADPSVIDGDGRPIMEKLAPFFYFPPRGGFYPAGKFMGTVEDVVEKLKE